MAHCHYLANNKLAMRTKKRKLGNSVLCEVTLTNWEILILASHRVQANAVPTEWRIDRLADELRSNNRFGKCPERLLSQLKATITAQRWRETHSMKGAHSVLYICHAHTTLGKMEKRALPEDKIDTHTLSVSPISLFYLFVLYTPSTPSFCLCLNNYIRIETVVIKPKDTHRDSEQWLPSITVFPWIDFLHMIAYT